MRKKYYGDPRFYQLIDKMVEIHSSKNHDYAGQEEPLSNFKIVYELTKDIPDSPFKVALTRLIEKILRICNIASIGNAVSDETINDTLLDSAVYSLLSRILIEEYGILPQQDKGGEKR